jgi:NAD-dependent deacetylase
MADTDLAAARARDLVRRARRIAVLTGAGVSAESGVPTFRGAGGLWRDRRPEELATPGAFARDPRLVWEWYAWRRELLRACRPNAAHLALARLALARAAPPRDDGGAEDGQAPVVLVTQNVDELHADAARQAAGDGDPAPALPLELHGSIWRVRCTGCGARSAHRGAIDTSSASTLPRCERCRALLRPDVVWFGEALDERVLDAAWAAAGRADVCLVVGTSAVVQPAASLALATLRRGGAVIEVNPEATPLTPAATVSLRGAAAAVVPGLVS